MRCSWHVDEENRWKSALNTILASRGFALQRDMGKEKEKLLVTRDPSFELTSNTTHFQVKWRQWKFRSGRVDSSWQSTQSLVDFFCKWNSICHSTANVRIHWSWWNVLNSPWITDRHLWLLLASLMVTSSGSALCWRHVRRWMLRSCYDDEDVMSAPEFWQNFPSWRRWGGERMCSGDEWIHKLSGILKLHLT